MPAVKLDPYNVSKLQPRSLALGIIEGTRLDIERPRTVLTVLDDTNKPLAAGFHHLDALRREGATIVNALNLWHGAFLRLSAANARCCGKRH
jgi:hypothetical protein